MSRPSKDNIQSEPKRRPSENLKITTINVLAFTKLQYFAVHKELHLTAEKTAGIEAKLVLTNVERFTLEKKLCQEAKRWQHQALRQTLIPKPEGIIRTRKILIIADIAWQCLIKKIL